MDKTAKDQFLKELMGATYEILYDFISRRQTDQGFVEDVVQETFLEAYRKAELLAEHPNQLGWLYVTARNKMMKMGGKRKDVCFFDGGEVVCKKLETEEEKYREVELVVSIKSAVSEKEYEMLRDYYLNGYCSKEVADKYGVDHGVIRMKMSRLKKKLREHDIAGLDMLTVCARRLP